MFFFFVEELPDLGFWTSLHGVVEEQARLAANHEILRQALLGHQPHEARVRRLGRSCLKNPFSTRSFTEALE